MLVSHAVIPLDFQRCTVLTLTQGTGTGIWATDMADKFPNSQVIGTDLSPIAPGMQPDNVTFEIDDCCSAWVYPEDHFDFVHIRGLFGSIGDWPRLYREAYRHLRPGCYIEQVEWSVHNRASDGTMSFIPEFAQWSQNAIRVATMTGKTFEIAENMAGLLREAGFTDVVEKRFKWPVGPWSSDPKLKEIGRWNLLNWEEGMEGWVMAAYTRVLGVSAAFRMQCDPTRTAKPLSVVLSASPRLFATGENSSARPPASCLS